MYRVPTRKRYWNGCATKGALARKLMDLKAERNNYNTSYCNAQVREVNLLFSFHNLKLLEFRIDKKKMIIYEINYLPLFINNNFLLES